MAHDGTGAGWDTASPADAEALKDAAKEMRDLRKGVETRVNREHTSAAPASVGGWHRAGSAVAYLGGAAPTTRPDGVTLLDANDNGRVWIDGGVIKYYQHPAWVAASVTGATSMAILSDVKANGTAGGAAVADTWQTRTLNTKVEQGLVVALAANQFTLNAGTYHIQARSPGHKCAGHKIRLRNITDATTPAVGASAYSAQSGDYGQEASNLDCVITIAGAKVFEIQHRMDEASGGGSSLGRAASTGESEVYTTVVIRKIG